MRAGRRPSESRVGRRRRSSAARVWRREGGTAMESLTGRLLVATPALKDPNFERTVVLLVAHEPGGSIGVVLNRATEVAVDDVLEGWGVARRRSGRRLRGRPGAARGRDLHRPREDARWAGSTASTGCPGAVGTLDLSQDPDALRRQDPRRPGLRRLRRLGRRASSKARSKPAHGSSSTRCPGDAFVDPSRRSVADGAAPPGRHDGGGRDLPRRPVDELIFCSLGSARGHAEVTGDPGLCTIARVLGRPGSGGPWRSW